MSLNEYPEPKGAYYTPALIAEFDDEQTAEEALASLRAAGFTTRDIGVSNGPSGVTVVVSEPTPGMLEQARGLLATSARDVRPYGAGVDTV